MFDQLKTVLELTNLEIQKISKPDNQKLQSMMKKSTNPFMSVKFLGDTPAVLSLGKLSEPEGGTMVRNHNSLKLQTNTMQHGKPRPDRCLRFVDLFFQLSCTYISRTVVAGHC